MPQPNLHFWKLHTGNSSCSSWVHVWTPTAGLATVHLLWMGPQCEAHLSTLRSTSMCRTPLVWFYMRQSSFWLVCPPASTRQNNAILKSVPLHPCQCDLACTVNAGSHRQEWGHAIPRSAGMPSILGICGWPHCVTPALNMWQMPKMFTKLTASAVVRCDPGPLGANWQRGA